MDDSPGLSPGPSPGSFLSGLAREEEEALVSRGRRRRFPKGSVLFSEGDPSDRVLLLLTGRVKISSLTEDGREVVLSVRGAGDLLGELSVIDGEPRSATATALDPVDGLHVGGDEFKEFLQEFPRVTLSLLQAVSGRLRESDRKRAEYGAYDTVSRVARRLLELAERFGEPEDGGVRITLPLSQQELAGFTGASREAVSKALQSLRGRGLIETRRRGILVRDLAGLRRRAG